MRKLFFALAASLLYAGSLCFAADLGQNEVLREDEQISRQIEELQQKRLEILMNDYKEKQKILENQRIEQEKKQMELAEKEKALAEVQKSGNEKVAGMPDPVGRVVYVEAPTVVSGSGKTDAKKLSGTDAIKKSVSDITVLPEYSDGVLKAFVYKPQMLYQIHCQPYHTTMIQLEPGEQLLEVPYLSETEVWRISRGTGIIDGKATLYLMLKPDKSNLDSTMIVITDRRVYQLQIKSFSDHYMPFVSWVYNNTGNEPWNIGSAGSILAGMNRDGGEEKEKPALIEDIIADKADILSFNYEIRSMSKTAPSWMPVAVFDNGQSTYIILDKQCLNMEMPACFENTKDVINKSVKKNVIVINKLTKKITLKLGLDRVTIRKI